MKRNMRIAALALLLIVLAVAAGVMLLGGRGDAPIQAGNLLENGSFEAVNGTVPDGWNTGMWVTSAGASYLEAVTLEDGTTAVLIENAAANDARFEQTVAVRENATYRLSARVRAEDCDPEKIGANLSFLGVYSRSEAVCDTDGEFVDLTVYAQTGEGQKEATVCARLGFYGSETTGRAWFTDMELTQVETVPVGAEIVSIATAKPQKEEKKEPEGTKDRIIPGAIAGGALYIAAAAFIAAWLLRERRGALGPVTALGGTRYVLLALICTAALLRMGFAATIEGYGVDMGCYGAWAAKMADGGPANFYSEGYFCDYPPGYMLVLWVVGLLAKVTGASLGGMDGQMLIKLMPIICDLALAIVLYTAFRERLGERASLGLCALTAFNPAFIVTSSCWGQIDSVLAVLLVVMLLSAREGKWNIAIPVFALAVLAKPQAGLLAPLGVAALIKDLCGEERKTAGRSMGWGLALGVMVTAAVALPFSLKQENPFWLVEKYIQTLSSYNYATLSTGNLMFLLGGNWVENSTILAGSVSYGAAGMALMVLSFAAGVAFYLKGRGRSGLYLASALTMQLIFCLGSKMHERYILPALALLVLAYMESRDVRLLIAAVISSAASFMNIGVVLAYDYLIAPNLWLGYVISVMQLASAAMTVFAAVSVLRGRGALVLPALEERQPEETASVPEESVGEERMRSELLHARDYRLHLRARDYVIMLALTAVYAAVAFYHLGAVKAPQSGFASTAKDETVVIDLGKDHEDFRIYYYGGISDTQFSFTVVDEAGNPSEEVDAFFDRGECFKWLALRNPVYGEDGVVTGANGGMRTFSGRYVRVRFKGAGAALWEVAAVTADGNVILPEGVYSEGGLGDRADSPVRLVDEQDTVPEKPTYMNSMYFDEIYHGRTGYEHANALHTYETTHPPLGKVFMSWCIRLMGMTPFAWRFAGTLCGVLMIPAMYLLAMQLIGKTRWAALCALLLAADCMHFTQTRIATIDSFPVLFMMLMFMFMARWMKMSFYHHRLRDTLVPLALSGVFMGLAIASKWIGCYGAVGLAVLFFARFYVLWRQSLYAKAHRDEDAAFARAAKSFAKNGALTIAACCVFFVLVPVTIYVLSYIPYLRAYGEVRWNLNTFERIWDAQVLMFDYHKNLVAEHYFASPWYEWPLIIKPMWFYAADFKGAGMASSILTFGNPAVWWTGLAAILFVLGLSVYRNALPALGALCGREDERDRVLPVIAVGFLSAYLPWVLVSRLTFIYHYFASVPWIIIATAYTLDLLEARRRKTARVLAVVLGAAAVVLFIAFYPLASGAEVPRAWCDAVAWFDGWMWY